ncbi:MAG TPA: CDP-diacylglycerol--glycerol-3-phosphate 3-phosphatidyltransferase [Clostridiaceae bacterium]|nr:CDP-diacylglycerol--glycerol-3-phosphate 3-phosphatidyltransferase [Clostridiaceae bacterium]
MNVPNILTAIRLLLIPSFAYFLYIESYKIAILLFALSGLTDILDGYIARRFNLVTSWGKLADPLADKLMQIAALIILTIQGYIPLFILITVILKEIMMGIGSIILLKKKKYVVSANWYGKLATFVFFIAIIMIMLDMPYSNYLIIAAFAFTIFAFINYVISYFKISYNNVKI